VASSFGQVVESRYPYTSGPGNSGTCSSSLINAPAGQIVQLSAKAQLVSPANSEAALMAVRLGIGG
jgi:hypothetical protein